MNRFPTRPLLVLLLAAPCLALGQAAGADKKPQAGQMSEDVEIMRRILNRALDLPRYSHQNVSTGQWNDLLNPLGGQINPMLGGPGQPVYQWDSWNNQGNNQPRVLWPNNNYWPNNTMSMVATLSFPSAEGVYLKGHGVVYNLVLPPQPDFKPDAAVPSADKPLSEWERVRKEVRGEKVDDKAKPKKNPTVLDILLKVLAENGTHLARLGPDETVTIVVTFRESEGAQNAGHNQFYQWGVVPNSNDLRNLDPLQFQYRNQPAGDDLTRLIQATRDSDPTPKAAQPKEVAEGKAKEVPAAVKDNLLLGDLNFKQGKHKEAEKAYLSALKLLETNPDDAVLRQVYQALAQTYLADGKTADAKNYIEKALAIEKKISEAPPPKKEATPASTVPAKLIVSAPKKLLDQVASEKISFEEFKKQATVEYLPTPAPEK